MASDGYLMIIPHNFPQPPPPPPASRLPPHLSHTSHTTHLHLTHIFANHHLCHTLYLFTHNSLTSHTHLSPPPPLSHAIFHTQLTHNFVNHLSHHHHHVLVAGGAAALCVAGVPLGHPPSFGVAGVVLGHIHLRFAWQAWHFWYWVAR